MKHFYLLVLLVLLVGGPALANERAEGEARLAALSGEIIAVMQRVDLQPEGMVCTFSPGLQGPVYLTFVPTASVICTWEQEGKERRAGGSLALSPYGAAQTRAHIAQMQDLQKAAPQTEAGAKAVAEAETLGGLQFFGAPAVRVILLDLVVRAAPSERVVGTVESEHPFGVGTPAAMVLVAEAMAALDMAAVEDLPQVDAFFAAQDDHRALLMAQRLRLAAMFPVSVGGVDPARIPPPEAYPNEAFFGVEPKAQADVKEAGVIVQVTLTTSSFELEQAAENGRFLATAKSGAVDRGAVYEDRGRVKVYLSENKLLAQIDGRATLILNAALVPEGSDPKAALEAVLAHFAANDFSDY